MIKIFYGQKLFRLLLAVAVICFGYLSFGSADYFDRLFIVVIFVLFAFYMESLKSDFFENINTVIILAILLIERIVEEIAFYTNVIAAQQIIIYLCAAIVFYKQKHDAWVRFLYFPITLLAGIISVYWYYTEYDAPNVHYSIAMLLLNVLVRQAFMMRVFNIKRLMKNKYAQKNATILQIDRDFMSIAKLNALLAVAMILEYLVRHFLLINSLTIYYSYSFLAHILSTISLFLIVDHLFNKHYMLTA